MRETNKNTMRGYFGFGVERISKPMNLGNLYRTAHGFGASFLFTVDAHNRVKTSETGLAPSSDTSKASENLPLYHYNSIDDLRLPEGCMLIGIELTDDAIDLPSFPHPPAAAYILGAEIYGLRPETMERCKYIIKIPTKFSLNLATAGAIVMYDRMRALGRFADRPLHVGGASQLKQPSIQPDGGRNRPRVLEELLRKDAAKRDRKTDII